MQPTPLFLPGKCHRQRSLEDYSPWDCKESNMTEHTHTHTHTYRQWRPWMKSKARKRWTSQIGRKAYFVRGCQGSPHWEKVTLGWNPKEKGCDILRFMGGSPLSAERATDAQALGLAPTVWQAALSWCCAWVCVGRWRGEEHLENGLILKSLGWT